MFKGIGNIIAVCRGETSRTLAIPIEFTSPITEGEWRLVQQAVYNRLNSSPVRVIIPGNLEKEFTVVFR